MWMGDRLGRQGVVGIKNLKKGEWHTESEKIGYELNHKCSNTGETDV